MPLAITFLWWADCPSHPAAWDSLQHVLGEQRIHAEVERIEVTTDEAALRWRFPGSPTILVNGRDIDPQASTAPARLTCRLYYTREGRPSPLPPTDMIREAIVAAQQDSPTKGDKEIRMLEIGQRGPDFALPGVDRATYALSDLMSRHHAVAIIFSCNHCPYVRAWEDRMKAIQRDYGERGVVLVAINSNDAVKYPEDDFTQMTLRAQEEGFNFLYLRDDSQDVARAYGAQRTPHVFLLGSDGTLRYRGAIDDNYDAPEQVEQHYLRDAIEAVLAGDRPVVETTEAIGCTVKWM